MYVFRPEYDFRSQYIVKVDDFFLHYLQKDSCTFELHQSFGTDYRTVAACQLKMRDILDKPQGRMHATVQLVGMLFKCTVARDKDSEKHSTLHNKQFTTAILICHCAVCVYVDWVFIQLNLVRDSVNLTEISR